MCSLFHNAPTLQLECLDGRVAAGQTFNCNGRKNAALVDGRGTKADRWWCLLVTGVARLWWNCQLQWQKEHGFSLTSMDQIFNCSGRKNTGWHCVWSLDQSLTCSGRKNTDDTDIGWSNFQLQQQQKEHGWRWHNSGLLRLSAAVAEWERTPVLLTGLSYNLMMAMWTCHGHGQQVCGHLIPLCNYVSSLHTLAFSVVWIPVTDDNDCQYVENSRQPQD